MRHVLGIDAAWTDKNPSGVALARETENGWELVRANSSYREFCSDAPSENCVPSVRNEILDVGAVIAACERLCSGRRPDAVAIDMPLSKNKITERRLSDNHVSREFGKYKCAVHSPNWERPGKISERIINDFRGFEFELWTNGHNQRDKRALLEVYPHTALLALTGDKERLRYKAGKTSNYWPDIKNLYERRALLIEVWQRIIALLETEIFGVRGALPLPSIDIRGHDLKAYEDKLDAVICAYVAIAALRGEAKAYGDDQSAIWVPEPRG